MTAGTVIGADRVITTLRNLRGAMETTVGRVVTEFGLDVLNAAKRNAPIKTGRLRRSIHLELFRDAVVIGGIVGTNVEYAARFEHGFKGAENVRAFTRKQTMAWGHPITPRMVNVRPFTRNANTPARPFLAPALESTVPTLPDRLRAALRDVPGVTR